MSFMSAKDGRTAQWVRVVLGSSESAPRPLGVGPSPNLHPRGLLCLRRDLLTLYCHPHLPQCPSLSILRAPWALQA